MTTREVLAVHERSSLRLDATRWSKLSSEPAFWQLVDRGILKASQAGRGNYQLSAGSLVGRANIGDLTIEVVEKTKGALAALLSFATASAFRVETLRGPRSELGPMLSLLIREFLRGLRTYASRGREKVYVKTRARGSLVGGRIDLVRSIALRARGMQHLVAFERNVLTSNTLKNRLFLAALREIEILSPLLPLEQASLFEARALSQLFSDCLVSDVLSINRRLFVRYAEQLQGVPRHDAEEDLLSLAGIILSNESFEYARLLPGETPRSWFVSLEVLFEKAVRRLLGELAGTSLRVESGAEFHGHLFPPGRVRVFPDFVIRHQGDFVAVGDAKYKKWGRKARRGDLYQVLAHAAAFSSPRAFLVIPSDRYEVRRLGKSATGALTWLFRVDVLDLRNCLKIALGEMGLESAVVA